MIKALIFDVDGTLADSERDGHRVAFNQAFKEAALVVSDLGEPNSPSQALQGDLKGERYINLQALMNL